MPTARLTGRSPAISWREQQRVGPKVIDETVKVTKRFLEGHPEEVAKISPTGLTGKPLKRDLIARFLGWPPTRVHYSLERLRLIEEGVLDKEAVESMPTDNAARELFDGDINGSACQWERRGRLRVPTPSPRLSPQGVHPLYPARLWLESSNEENNPLDYSEVC